MTGQVQWKESWDIELVVYGRKGEEEEITFTWLCLHISAEESQQELGIMVPQT